MAYGIGGVQNQKRLIRAQPNPMDKSTIVSIYPKPIYERKPTIQPGEFRIAAGTYDKPAILVVGSSSWWRDTENDMALEIPHWSIQIADSIVNDYCNGLHCCNMGDAMPGLFHLPGNLTVAEIKTKHKAELDNAAAKQKNYFKALILEADVSWARTNGNPIAISDEMRLAAQELGAKDKPWMKDFTTYEMSACPACGNLRNTAFPVCPHCKNVVDVEKAKALGLKFSVQLMSITSGAIMDRSAALLNDAALTIFTYTAQLPYLNIALDELQEEMEQNNVPLTNAKSADITVPTGTTSIVADPLTDPHYPSDLVEIQAMWESLYGTTDPPTLMIRCDFLPQLTVLTEELIYWTWQNQTIYFLGATSDRTVNIEYIAARYSSFSNVDGSDTINLINCESFLAYRTAALCAQFIGENEQRANDLNVFAKAGLDRFLAVNTKGRQVITTRRRPFMAAYKVRGNIS